MKFTINDIVAFNSQGVFSVGIITKIIIVGEDSIIYGIQGIDCNLDVLEENIVKCIGNARVIKEEFEVGQDDQ